MSRMRSTGMCISEGAKEQCCLGGARPTAMLAVMVIMSILDAATADGLRRCHRPDTTG